MNLLAVARKIYETSFTAQRLMPLAIRGYLTKFNTGRLRPEVQPLTLLNTILAEKVPLLYNFYCKKVPLSHTYL